VGQQLPGVWGSCPVALLLLPCRCGCAAAACALCCCPARGGLWGRGCGAEGVEGAGNRSGKRAAEALPSAGLR
ncbi:hypothetical protein V8C86DRAFT_2517750, partial [Haematococcus lacustris]